MQRAVLQLVLLLDQYDKQLIIKGGSILKNNYEKSEKPGRIIIENSLFCEIDEECIYRKIQGMDRHRTDEYTINENAMKEDVINEDITDGHNSDKSNID